MPLRRIFTFYYFFVQLYWEFMSPWTRIFRYEFFTTLDSKIGYWKIHLTIVIDKTCLIDWNVFFLNSNAIITLQCICNFRKAGGNSTTGTFLEDLFIIPKWDHFNGNEMKTQLQKFEQVFQLLQVSKLKLNSGKLFFLQKECNHFLLCGMS